jgi:plasmid stabilization system protein ParE
MAYQVIYKKRFNNKLIQLLQYLEQEWGQKVSVEFLSKIDKRIETLKQQPFIGKPSEKKPEVRAISITKHNRLYYKISNNKIVILNLFDTRKSSKNNPFD